MESSLRRNHGTIAVFGALAALATVPDVPERALKVGETGFPIPRSFDEPPKRHQGHSHGRGKLRKGTRPKLRAWKLVPPPIPPKRGTPSGVPEHGAPTCTPSAPPSGGVLEPVGEFPLAGDRIPAGGATAGV